MDDSSFSNSRIGNTADDPINVNSDPKSSSLFSKVNASLNDLASKKDISSSDSSTEKKTSLTDLESKKDTVSSVGDSQRVRPDRTRKKPTSSEEVIAKLEQELKRQTSLIKEHSEKIALLQKKINMSNIQESLPPQTPVLVLPAHIEELISKIINKTNSTQGDLISKGILLLGLALKAKEQGAEIAIIDNDGKILSKIVGLD